MKLILAAVAAALFLSSCETLEPEIMPFARRPEKAQHASEGSVLGEGPY